MASVVQARVELGFQKISIEEPVDQSQTGPILIDVRKAPDVRIISRENGSERDSNSIKKGGFVSSGVIYW